ncbi:MAG TPA: cytidine deaminase [Clostridiaceae bacterium]|nr:cytidine deaminase [Clostridiaceae bacterium]
MINTEMKLRLVEEAFLARESSYAPYSRFKVGAAILTTDGRIFRGANIENASYGATICAERTAAVKAVSEGAEAFVAIAVVGAEENANLEALDLAYPCGICRQVLREFLPTSGEMIILVATSPTAFFETTLHALLPHSFGPEDLDYLME